MEDGRDEAPLGDDNDDDDDDDGCAPGLIDTDDEDDEETPTLVDDDEDDDSPTLGAAKNTPFKPKWRAEVCISVGRRSVTALADSGCSISCISRNFYLQVPALAKSFVPVQSSGRAINGSEVPAIGEVLLDFWVEGRPMTTPCKVIDGLVNPIVLGWDWMFEKGVSLDANKGLIHFERPSPFSAPLVENPASKPGHFYRVTEDVTLPPNS